jgi:hypothetical protein
MSTDLPPYEPQRILSAPFPERVRLVCTTFASASPNSPAVMALYWAKYFFVYIAGWVFFVCFDASTLSFGSFFERAFTEVAFYKAVTWSIFYELTGLGCAWGRERTSSRATSFWVVDQCGQIAQNTLFSRDNTPLANPNRSPRLVL